MNWFIFWLFLHILAAVVAFGPIFVFPIVGTLAAQSPQHIGFAVRLNQRIETRLVIPFALTMVVSGSGLIWTGGINFFASVYLIVAVALYLVSLTIALGVLLPTTEQLLHLVEHAPAPVGSVAGPPPQVMALVRRNQIFGGVATVLFLVIIYLMVVQPGGLSFR